MRLFSLLAPRNNLCNVTRDVLAGIIEGCVYKSKQSISKRRIGSTRLVPGWNQFSGEDYISGRYKGRKIELSDVHLKYVHTSKKGHRTTETVFKGHWLVCELAKELPAFIRICESGGKSNVETENIAFNKKYNIFTDYPYYVFYVLTPHFMEYIVSADEAACARTYFYFKGNEVHIAVDSRRNSFQDSGADRNNIEMARERIRTEMDYITGILDELLQNEYLFGEE